MTFHQSRASLVKAWAGLSLLLVALFAMSSCLKKAKHATRGGGESISVGKFLATTNPSSSGFTLNWAQSTQSDTGLALPSDVEYCLCEGSSADEVLSEDFCSREDQRVTSCSHDLRSFVVTGKETGKSYFFNVYLRSREFSFLPYEGVEATTTSDKAGSLVPGTAGTWREVFSIGQKTDRFGTALSEVGMTAQMCQGVKDCIRIAWTPFTSQSGSAITGYRVYRRSEGQEFDYNRPLAELNKTAASDLFFVDTSADLEPGNFYFYKVTAKVGNDYIVGTNPISDLRVLKPANNFAFVHRSAVNAEICGLMGRGVGQDKGSDPNQNYRCEFEGFGSKTIDGVKYYDFNKDLVVDRFENGCNYTANVCSSHDVGDTTTSTDCYGMTDPADASNTVTAPAGSVYFSRNTTKCWINTNGGSGWTAYASISTDADRIAMGTNAAHAPVLINISSIMAANHCKARTVEVAGSDLPLRAPRRSEYIAYAAWQNFASGPDIEVGANTDGYCNTDNGHGVTFGTAYPGSNPDLLAGKTSKKIFVAGSTATRDCVSRYGIQDLVGNAYETTSDQFVSGVASVPPTTDADNLDFASLAMTAPLLGTTGSAREITYYPYYSVALGVPLSCSTFGTDPASLCHADDFLVPSSMLASTGDKIWMLSHSSGVAFYVGGLFADGHGAGRFRVGMDQVLTGTSLSHAPRCVAEISQ